MAKSHITNVAQYIFCDIVLYTKYYSKTHNAAIYDHFERFPQK